MRAFSTAVTGMRAQQTNVDIIANNIANVNTTGFKKARGAFEDLFYQQLRRAGTTALEGRTNPTGIEVGTGVRLAGTPRNFEPGSPLETSQPLDLLIDGQGFFRVQTFDGRIAFTRDGSFGLDSQGNIVTPDGFLLDPGAQVDLTTVVAVQVTPEGIIQTIDFDSTVNDVGQIELARFPNPGGLTASGDNLFQVTEASGPETTGQPGTGGFGVIQSGFLEQSNVDVVEEMVGLIRAQRAFDVNSNSIQVADEMLQVANNLRR
jgi:flagellar basal-body rod protein FlgG